MFGPSLHSHYRNFFTTTTSADFSQFVVTTANETACETSPLKVRTLSLHVPATFTGTSSNFWTSAFPAALSVFPSLICGFCPSGQRFAYSFLQIPPHDGHPCCSAIHFSLPGHVQDFHLRERAHGAQTKRAPPGAHNAKRSPLVRLLSSTTHIFLTPGSCAAPTR